MRKIRIALVTAMAVLAGFPAMAERERWSMTDGWNVSFYPSLQGCLAYASFEGTAFFIGFDTIQSVPALDITVLDERWTSFKQDGLYPISVKFGDEPAWTLEMHGVYMDGAPGLNILIDAGMEKSAHFVEEFQREMEMIWTHGETELGHFTLRGSRRAFDQVLACQDAHSAALTAQSTAAPDPASE
ncbi:hypothetical protein ACXYMO_05980 [Arenibacterium sp. CAU 1754]